MTGQRKISTTVLALSTLATAFFNPCEKGPSATGAALVDPPPVSAQGGAKCASLTETHELASELRESRERLHNLRIDYSASVGLASKEGVFLSKPDAISGTAWFEGAGGTKERVLVKKSLRKWEAGQAPQLEESYDYGFDGSLGREARYNFGPPGHSLIAPVACTIFSTRPKEMDEQWRDYCIGTDFTVTLGHRYPTGTLDGMLSRTTEAECARVFISTELRDGVNLRVLQMVSPIGMPQCVAEYAFDPARGYALVSFLFAASLHDGSVASQKEKINALQEVGAGVWFPKSATRETSAGAIIERTEFNSTSAVANDPNFGDQICEVPFPPGSRVTDARLTNGAQPAAR